MPVVQLPDSWRSFHYDFTQYHNGPSPRLWCADYDEVKSFTEQALVCDHYRKSLIDIVDALQKEAK